MATEEFVAALRRCIDADERAAEAVRERVIEDKSGEAAGICNDGAAAMLAYLQEGGTTVDEVAELVRERVATCSLCHLPCRRDEAHWHAGEIIGDECCWDERLRASE